MPNIESEKIDCLYPPCSRPAPRGKIESVRTQKSSNSLIRFRCSNSCFLLESDIAGHERLFLTKWHPKAEKKLWKRRFFDTADRHDKLYGRSRLYASAQGRHETGGVLSLYSRLSFDISIKNSLQRWSSDFQGLFRVKIRKMAQGSDDLSTLPLTLSRAGFFGAPAGRGGGGGHKVPPPPSKNPVPLLRIYSSNIFSESLSKIESCETNLVSMATMVMVLR